MPRLMPTPARCRPCRHLEVFTEQGAACRGLLLLRHSCRLCSGILIGGGAPGLRFNISWLCEMFVPKISGVFLNNVPVL